MSKPQTTPLQTAESINHDSGIGHYSFREYPSLVLSALAADTSDAGINALTSRPALSNERLKLFAKPLGRSEATPRRDD